jgi:hypothetical protein
LGNVVQPGRRIFLSEEYSRKKLLDSLSRDELLDQKRILEWWELLRAGGLDSPERLEEVRNKVLHGVPARFLGSAWKAFARTAESYRSDGYNRLVAASAQDEDLQRAIGKDTARTFPNHPYFNTRGLEGQKELARILGAYGIACPRVGYVQGLNFIAGFILATLQKEEDAFWILVRLMNFMGAAGFFVPLTPGVTLFKDLFSELLAEHLPDLDEQLRAKEVPIDLFATKWFLSMFTYSVPFEAAVTIWGLIFTDGMESLIVVGLGLLKLLKSSLLACKSDDEIRSVLEGLKEEMPFTGKDVIKTAIGMQVSADRMVDIRTAWMRDHPAEAAALAPVPFDCDNIMHVPAAATVPASALLPGEAKAIAQLDPPPPPPPPIPSDPDLPAVVSDDNNLGDEGDAGFQPPGRQPGGPPSSKSDTLTAMDGFFDRPSSAPDGSGMLDYPELRKMTPPMLSPTVCDPQEMIIRTKADQAMLSVEGLPDWRSHLESGIEEVAQEKPPSRETLDRRIPSLDPSVRRIQPIQAMQETDDELQRRFSSSFGTSDSSPRRKDDRSSPTRRRNTSSQYRLSTSVGPRSRGKRVTTTADADEKKADDDNAAFAESRARSEPRKSRFSSRSRSAEPRRRPRTTSTEPKEWRGPLPAAAAKGLVGVSPESAEEFQDMQVDSGDQPDGPSDGTDEPDPADAPEDAAAAVYTAVPTYVETPTFTDAPEETVKSSATELAAELAAAALLVGTSPREPVRSTPERRQRTCSDEDLVEHDDVLRFGSPTRLARAAGGPRLPDAAAPLPPGKLEPASPVASVVPPVEDEVDERAAPAEVHHTAAVGWLGEVAKEMPAPATTAWLPPSPGERHSLSITHTEPPEPGGSNLPPASELGKISRDGSERSLVREDSTPSLAPSDAVSYFPTSVSPRDPAMSPSGAPGAAVRNLHARAASTGAAAQWKPGLSSPISDSHPVETIV